MRTGKIIFLEEGEHKGILMDENDQEIEFLVHTFAQKVSLHDIVQYRIELFDEGLIAVGI